MGRVIAIDGPSGAGKSTIARMLAARLGFVYLDTGALYRAVALLFLRKGITPEDSDRVLAAALESAEVRFRDGRVFLNGEDISQDIRTPEVGHYSSVFSARRAVREFLLNVQRNAALDNDLVAEGRDTTTVIFPHARKKFFMDASVAERTKRRYRQLKEMGMEVTEKKAERDVVERDERDRGRDIAPLTKAPDAIIIDTTEMSIEQIIGKLLEIVKSDPQKTP
ncbi:MAG TPA: (d)CMP kinase [Thermodesulfovibrionales bacterium]|nr:(d)CMP kinase [Thermodesulfovibrionales bacterium]